MADEDKKLIEGEWRAPVPTRSGESRSSISLGRNMPAGERFTNLATMLGSAAKPKDAANLRNEIMMSPTGSINVIPETKGKYVQEAEAAIAASAPARPKVATPKPRPSIFQRGDRAFDTKVAKNVVILRTNVKFTDDLIPIHEVADKRGNKWTRRETRLVKQRS